MAQTTTSLAIELDTTPRTLRKFLRSADMGVGKGSRYALPTAKREVASLKKRFDAWDEARNAPKTDEAPEAPEVEEIADEVEVDFDELDCPLDD